ncbi:cupin domain-containing protein [Pedobacter aquatilis]|uniref:(R)-mandelonitrile lyase n=1 Tax=Pedobacter aquatilis TaxID=351343 RepID=UPI00292DEAAC|nr:cupin domain-containing protein [Pedobacter aquatilis]
MKNIMIALIGMVFFTACHPKIATKPVKTALFSDGNQVRNGNFTGEVWLNMLMPADTTYNSHIGSVSFKPGARSNWHYHPGGQILLVTEGKGWYQEQGKKVQVIQKGDIIKCLPNVHHWHGASATDRMTHLAIGTNINKGTVVWLSKVTDEEYQYVGE